MSAIMTLAEMKEYLAYCLEGPSSIPERKEILAVKKEALLASMEKLQKAIDYIDWKQNFYDDVLSGKIEYHSNLISDEEFSHFFSSFLHRLHASSVELFIYFGCGPHTLSEIDDVPQDFCFQDKGSVDGCIQRAVPEMPVMCQRQQCDFQQAGMQLC